MDKRIVLLTGFLIFWTVEAAIYYGSPEKEEEEEEEAADSTDYEDNPRAIATNGNYSVSFVPLISLLAGVVPRLLSRLRGTPIAAAKKLDFKVPQELTGINPCIDDILDRKPYPGSSCYFYECELYESSSAACNVQTLLPSDQLPSLDPNSISQSDRVRINKCLAIRIYKCAPSYKYNSTRKNCVRENSNFYDLACPT